jgi:DNA-binding NarL/FixJ family response regulator
MNKENKILLADDHPLFRVGVKTLIDSFPGYRIVDEANNGSEAIEKIEKYLPEIAILDLDMPEKNGYEVATYISENNLHIKIIFLTSHSDLSLFQEAYSTKFSGFLFKESALEELETCLKYIQRGEQYISPLSKKFMAEKQDEIGKIKVFENKIKKLTKTEKQILYRISQNKTTKEIAEELFNSYKTIENHRLNICHKLNLKGTNNLLSFAIDNKQSIKKALNKKTK